MPHFNVNLNINVLISTPEKRPLLLKGHFSVAKGVASKEGLHLNTYINTYCQSLLFVHLDFIMFSFQHLSSHCNNSQFVYSPAKLEYRTVSTRHERGSFVLANARLVQRSDKKKLCQFRNV